jgi:hypothetical protein
MPNWSDWLSIAFAAKRDIDTKSTKPIATRRRQGIESTNEERKGIHVQGKKKDILYL